MKPDEKDALLRTIADPGAGGTHGREAAKAKLEAALAEEMNLKLAQVAEDIFQFKKTLGERLNEQAAEIKSTRDAMNASSKEMTALTRRLVFWAGVSVAVIAIYTLLTGILVWIQSSQTPH